MTATRLMRLTALSTILAVSTTIGAAAQTAAGPPHRNATLAQAPTAQGQGAPPAQPGMMRPGMMGQGTMGQGMMGQGSDMMMMRPGMMGGMPMMAARGNMMKIMFAVADTDGDGALSFEEIMAVHKRIFDKVDANKDGKATLEEVQAFMRE
jgi:hypothetical protein